MRIKKIFSLVAASILAINILSPTKVLADGSAIMQVIANMDDWRDADEITYNVEYIERDKPYKMDIIKENEKAADYSLSDYGNWKYIGWTASSGLTDTLYDFDKPVTEDLQLKALYKQSINPEIAVLLRGTLLFTKPLGTFVKYDTSPKSASSTPINLFFNENDIKFTDDILKSLNSEILDYATNTLHYHNPQVKYITHLDDTAYKDISWYSDAKCTEKIKSITNEKLYTKLVITLTCEHQYQTTITKQPTCTQKGTKVFTCDCGNEYTKEITPLGHIEDAPVIENKVEPTYDSEGSYDEVIYCARTDNGCNNSEISRIHKTIDKLTPEPHTHSYKLTDSKEATCVAKGYEKFECECGDEYYTYSDALNHIEGKAVIENKVEAKVGIKGSYDEVIYCDRCHEELKREHKTISALSMPKPEPEPESPAEPEPEPLIEEEIEKNIATVAVVSTVATVSGGSTGAFFFIFWWRRRKIKGTVSGNTIANLRVTLTGKDNLETLTNEYGEFEFKNIKSDNLFLTIYDENEAVVFSTEIYTKGKNNDDTFEVVDNHAHNYELNKSGKTYTIDIEK